jgi:DNA-binding CsgD family transcriptional regulator
MTSDEASPPSVEALSWRIEAGISRIARGEAPAPAGLVLFATGQAQVMAGLSALERRTRRSVWSLHPGLRYDPEDPADALNERSRARGIDLQGVTTPRALEFHPLLSSLCPWTRIGSVTYKALVIDGAAAILSGPPTTRGEPQAFLATSGVFLRAALSLWTETFRASAPLLAAGVEPPLNGRQLEVARTMCLGMTDSAMARHLGVSQRTVARDVHQILVLTGATSRSDAVLCLLGRGRQAR